MKVESFQCDECGKRRDSDANRWFLFYLSGPSYSVFSSTQWFAPAAEDVGIGHACGEECALRAYQRWLQTGKLEKEKPPVKRPTEPEGLVPDWA